MESDIGNYTANYSGLTEGTPKILDLLDRYDIRATFNFTAIAAQKGARIVDLVSRRGHEIACHSYHHDALGEPLIESPMSKPVPPSEIENLLRLSTDTVEKISGKRPVSFRAPCLWLSTEAMKALERIGYIADSSYPTYYFEKQLLPYHPSSKNWLDEGEMDILEIPVVADVTMESKEKTKRDRDAWPLWRTISAEECKRYADHMRDLQLKIRQVAVLSFYMHPWEFIRMPRKLVWDEAEIKLKEFIWKGTGKKAIKEFNKLIKMFEKDEVEFVTISELTNVWEKEFCPRHSGCSQNTDPDFG